jgi:hypothetical protein
MEKIIIFYHFRENDIQDIKLINTATLFLLNILNEISKEIYNEEIKIKSLQPFTDKNKGVGIEIEPERKRDKELLLKSLEVVNKIIEFKIKWLKFVKMN